jgi:hypothetical protein
MLLLLQVLQAQHELVVCLARPQHIIQLAVQCCQVAATC